MRNTIKEGRRIVAEMSNHLLKQDRSPQPAKEIRLAVKCGSSDATSGIAANPATGKAVDFIIEKGGAAVFGETTEFIGAEHILAKRGIKKEVERKILEIVDRSFCRRGECHYLYVRRGGSPGYSFGTRDKGGKQSSNGNQNERTCGCGCQRRYYG